MKYTIIYTFLIVSSFLSSSSNFATKRKKTNEQRKRHNRVSRKTTKKINKEFSNLKLALDLPEDTPKYFVLQSAVTYIESTNTNIKKKRKKKKKRTKYTDKKNTNIILNNKTNITTYIKKIENNYSTPSTTNNTNDCKNYSFDNNINYFNSDFYDTISDFYDPFNGDPDIENDDHLSP